MKRVLGTFFLKIRRRETPLYRFLYDLAVRVRRLRVPDALMPFYRLLYRERSLRISVFRRLATIFYYEPLFRSRCRRVGPGLQFIKLRQGLPVFSGNVRVELGSEVIVHSRATFAAGHLHDAPLFMVGDHTYLGPGLTVSVAERITVGSHCHLASNVSLYDNDTHPLDPEKRAAGEPVTAGEVHSVVIGDHVWIGEGSIVLKGVHIGDRAVIGAGSVVTRDISSGAVAAGNPARVIKLQEPHLRKDL